MATAFVVVPVLVVVAPFVINKFVAICFLAARRAVFAHGTRSTFPFHCRFSKRICRISFAAILDILCAHTHIAALSVRVCVCVYSKLLNIYKLFSKKILHRWRHANKIFWQII